MLTLGLRAIAPLIFVCASFASGEIPRADDRDRLAEAVRARKIVTFVYQGQPRTVEPHACGISVATGEAVLHGYQTAGGSSSGSLPGWRTFVVAKIAALEIGEATFSAPREGYAAGRPHLDPVWAELRPAPAP